MMIIQLLGVILLVAGVAIIARPALFLDYLQRNLNSKSLYASAIAFRLILGIVLIALAARSHYPLTIKTLGGMSVLVAIFIAVIGQQKFVRMFAGIVSRLSSYTRAGGIMAMALGGFLIHAFY